jgi:hypothetical protein
LPTSLIYIVLSTRGCSPWRPAAVMSTTRCESYSFPWIFKGCRERTGHNRSVVLCQPPNPSSRQSDFRVMGCQGEKRTLPGAPASVSKFSYVAIKDPRSGSGILTGFPFDRRREESRGFETELPYLLGSTDPCPTAVTMEPFSTSVFKVLT